MIKELEEIGLLGNVDVNSYTTYKIVFKNKPSQDICMVLENIYKYIHGPNSSGTVTMLKEETGSYIVTILVTLATLAAFNIGTFLLTGGVKHLIRFRAALSVLTAPKLPEEYYLEVQKPDQSLQLSEKILTLLTKVSIDSIPENIKHISNAGFNAENIKEITEENTLHNGEE